MRRIDAIFDFERTINGQPREQRQATRQDKIAPLVTDLEGWMRDVRRTMSRHADVAKAIDYMLKRWASFSRFLDDGRICLTNNAADGLRQGLLNALLNCKQQVITGNPTPSRDARLHEC